MRESWLMELAERFINDPISRTKIGRMGAKEVIAEIHADLGLRSDGKIEHNRIAVLSLVLPNTSGYQDGQSRPASRSDAEERQSSMGWRNIFSIVPETPRAVVKETYSWISPMASAGERVPNGGAGVGSILFPVCLVYLAKAKLESASSWKLYLK